MCLSYWDITNLIDLEPAGGTYIYSASEAYDEEQRFDHERLKHWLDLFRLRKVGGLAGAEQGPFHASGHIDGPGMEWVIETINPARILPVHTQKLGWFETRWPEKVVRANPVTPDPKSVASPCSRSKLAPPSRRLVTGLPQRAIQPGKAAQARFDPKIQNAPGSHPPGRFVGIELLRPPADLLCCARGRPRTPLRARIGLESDQYIPPMPPPGAAGAGFSSFFSTTTHSVVRSKPAIDAAF